METKKGDMLNLWNVLEAVKNQKQSVKFSYFIAKNKLAIKSEIDALNKAREVSESFKLYDQKRASLASELADRMPGTDQPLTNNNQYIITEKKEEFDTKLEELKQLYKKELEYRIKQGDAFKQLLDENVKFEGVKISIEDIPESVEPAMLEVFLLNGLLSEGDE